MALCHFKKSSNDWDKLCPIEFNNLELIETIQIAKDALHC